MMKNVTNNSEFNDELIPVVPKITNKPVELGWNMEHVKNYLKSVTEKYTNMVVTDENVEDSQRALREVVSLRTSLKRFEREGKQLLSMPTHLFKNQCDELGMIIEDVEKPLRKQLDRYETARIEAIDRMVNTEFSKKASAAKLKAEYIAKFVPDKRWYNKTAKWSDTTKAIDSEVSRLMAEQTAEEEKVKMMEEKKVMVKTFITMTNEAEKLSTPINANKYIGMVENISFNEIKDFIESDVKRQKEIEVAAAMRAQEVQKQQEQNEDKILSIDTVKHEYEINWNSAEDEENSLPETKETTVLPPATKSATAREIPQYTVTVNFFGVLGEYDLEQLQDKLERIGFEFEVTEVKEV